LLSGVRALKSEPIFEILGTLDELNAHLGFVQSVESSGVVEVKPQLEDIQSWLLDMGSCLAKQPAGDDGDDEYRWSVFEVPAVDLLESWIDTMDDALPPLQNFILPVCVFNNSCHSSASHTMERVADWQHHLCTLLVRCVDVRSVPCCLWFINSAATHRFSVR
jgi:cob(I)alamin adenosyltransferase